MTTLQYPDNFELVKDSVMTRTMEGMINFWNRSSEDLYGWRKEEAVGRVSHDLLQTQFPKPLEEIESELRQNGLWEGRLVHTTRDGGRVVVESRWTLEFNGQPGPVVEINARSVEPAVGMAVGRQARSLTKADGLLPKIASVVLAGGGVFCIFLLMYIAYYYGWTGQRRFSAPLGMVLYCVFPAILAGLLFLSLRRSPEFKVNAALLCLSLSLSVFAGELFLRLTRVSVPGLRIPVMNLLWKSENKEEDAVRLGKRFGIEVDSRDGLEVVDDFRKRGVDAVPIITASNNLFVTQPDGSIKSALSIHGTEVIPFGGISNKVTVLCNESGQWITYESDEHGFNNPGKIWESGQIDVAALGDSFAQGYCVPSNKDFVALIRRGYPSILNLGMAGNGPLLELATLKEYLPAFKPKVVLWFYFEGNDLANLEDEKKSDILMRYLKGDFNQGLLARQTDIDEALLNHAKEEAAKAKEKKVTRPHNDFVDVDQLLGFLQLAALRQRLGLIYGLTTPEAELLSDVRGPNVDLFREILVEAQSRVKSWGGTLYFVYLPGWGRYANYSEIGADQRAEVLTMVKTLGLPVIDVQPVFQAQKDPLSLFPFREPGHYNEKGHELVAQEVLKALPHTQP